ncbi:MAG TPA: hypothetical protein VHB25_02825 [Gemmatimonadaceae bacterium]|nr:hypothetical protein [Gemmatimonadaceae bacterium]
MSEYRIEKIRRGVTLRLAGGATLAGDVFVQPTARFRAGPQDPAELFNEPEPFIPIATVEDELILVAKDQVAHVQFPGDSADTAIEGIADAAVDVWLADGTSLSGVLRLETRADRSRVLDFLNDEHQRFLALQTPFGICLVNRRHITQVRHRR